MASTLARLLRPRSVAIVGASADPSSIGGAVLANLERFGYAGEIHLVSRSRAEINGRRCVAGIEDLPDGIDAIVLNVPQAAVLDAVAACGRRGVGGAVVFASGYAEAGEQGRANQEALAAAAGEAGIPVNGPNCLGFVNFLDGVPLTFEWISRSGEPVRRGVAVIGQSGAMVGNIRAALAARGVALAYAVSTGNELNAGAEDFLAEFADDPRVGAITLFMEQVRRPARFLDLVARFRQQGKPLVMMHPGRTARARESARSHTGALAGDHAVMRAIVAHAGVALVDNLDELFDVTALLARWPDPPALGTAVVSNSGAFRGIALDFCEQAGLDLPPLSPSTVETLRSVFPPHAVLGNPLDTMTLAFSRPDIFARSLRAFLEDPNLGSVIVSLVPGAPPLQVAKSDTILPVVQTATKPVALVMMGDEEVLTEEFTRAVRSSAVPFFRSPERAMRAMALITAHGRSLQSLQAAASAPPVPPAAFDQAGTVPEFQAKRMLAAAGIRVPEGELARDEDQAVAIAGRIGYPVVLKAQSRALAHKSDAGGVILGIADAAGLRDAWARLHRNIERVRPDVAIEGVLVEKMAGPGLEMFVGARRDPNWGPILVVGMGGVWIEALEDVRLLPPALGEAQIVAEMRKLRGARLLSGFRGAPRVDEAAVARTLTVIAGLMRASPEVCEIDVNPLVAYPEGQGALALDALIVVSAS